MNLTREPGSPNSWVCELCDFEQFSTYFEFHCHHLIHVREPVLRLVKLNPNTVAKLQETSYRVNTGVAKRSAPFEHVPPLKISLVKQQGTQQFHVKKEETLRKSDSPNSGDTSDFDTKEEEWEELEQNEGKGNSGVAEVEGKNILERFGANTTISRKAKPTRETLDPESPGYGNRTWKKEADAFQSGVDHRKENILERLCGIGEISISPSIKPKSSTNGNTESKPTSGISISTKQKSIDLSQLKRLKDQEGGDNNKKVFDKNKILEKLSGSGLILIPPKSQIKTQEDKGSTQQEDRPEEGPEEGSPTSQAQAVVERIDGGVTGSNSGSNSEDSNDGSEVRSGGGDANTTEPDKVINENSSESSEQKKFVRVKNSTFSKKNVKLGKQNSREESPEERTSPSEESRDKELDQRERGIDILERLTDNLNNSVGAEKSAESESVDFMPTPTPTPVTTKSSDSTDSDSDSDSDSEALIRSD